VFDFLVSVFLGFRLRGSHTIDSKVQTLGGVSDHCGRIQVSPGKSDVAVRAQEVERGLRDLCAREFPVVGSIAWNLVDAQQVA
jgi:hypothetical protein